MSLHFTDHQVTAITYHLCKRMGSNILYTLIKMYRDACVNVIWVPTRLEREVLKTRESEMLTKEANVLRVAS
jgi:hypothetical protein